MTSHQVLARKWRPGSFQDLVGQPHVVRALTNALSHQRLHHAYLFAGTRGIGKTTIARIMARCLNCATGITASPCGVCQSCIEIAEGRHLDLIEVDAASKTRIDDTRELLDNVAFAPVTGRFKVYLIDEVHMLSEKSFNALLKTLEEPPAHVKFLLATTDPQKLPVTVLSRCLQFNLKPMPANLIAEHLQRILAAETASAEPGALLRLGEAAAGSMRDALSLTEQALAYSGGELTEAAVSTMIGLLPRTHLTELLDAVWLGDGARMLDILGTLETLAPDWSRLLEELAVLVHNVAVAQVLQHAQQSDAVDDGFGDPSVERWIQLAATREAAEEIQLSYEILVHGSRDLPFAPEPRIGVEMTLLRMLAFRPLPTQAHAAGNASSAVAAASQSPQDPAANRLHQNEGLRVAEPVAPTRAEDPRPPSSPAQAKTQGVAEPVAPTRAEDPPPPSSPAQAKTQASHPGNAALDWYSFAQSLAPGTARELALQANLVSANADQVVLAVDASHRSLATARSRQRLNEALNRHLGRDVKLAVSTTPDAAAAGNAPTPAALIARGAAERAEQIEAELHADPVLQTLKETFGAEVTRIVIDPLGNSADRVP